MRRTSAHHGKSQLATIAIPDSLPGGMALLGAIEIVLSFTVIYAVIQAPGVFTSLPAFLPTLMNALPRAPVEQAAILTLTLAAVALSIGLYRPEICLDRGRLAIAAVVSAFAAFTVFTLLVGSLNHGLTTAQAIWIGRIVAIWALTTGLIRLGLRFIVRHQLQSRKVLVLGLDAEVERLGHRLQSRLGRSYELIVSPDIITSDANAGKHHAQILEWPALINQGLWGVVTTSRLTGAATEALLDCKLRGLRVLSGTDFQEHNLGRIDLDALTQEAFLTANGFVATRLSDYVKRGCDLALSTAMLALTLPLMLVTALAIKADSPGPVFYRQTRIGAFGRPFTVLKFRSMATDAEAGGKPRWAQKHDPRITRVGRLIRTTRIDELPQLINIIRGEMSLVGPRPERPHFVEQLTKVIPFYAHRRYVKPGLTGWAQVNYPYGASIEDSREKLAYDLYYVKHRSVWLDLRILLATVRVVLTREGAR